MVPMPQLRIYGRGGRENSTGEVGEARDQRVRHVLTTSISSHRRETNVRMLIHTLHFLSWVEENREEATPGRGSSEYRKIGIRVADTIYRTHDRIRADGDPHNRVNLVHD